MTRWKRFLKKVGILKIKKPRVINYKIIHSVCDDLAPYIRSSVLIKQLSSINITNVNALAGSTFNELRQGGISYSHIRCLKRFLRYNKIYNELLFEKEILIHKGNIENIFESDFSYDKRGVEYSIKDNKQGGNEDVSRS